MKLISRKPMKLKRVTRIVRRARATAPRRRVVRRRRRRVRQLLGRFTVLAVRPNASNTPHDTSGWTVTATSGAVTRTAEFDDFGVAIFSQISTLTNTSFTIRVRDEAGNQLFQATAPANREFFVARFAV